MEEIRSSPVTALPTALLQRSQIPAQRMLPLTSRPLLTERSSVKADSDLSGKQMETHTIRATTVTTILKDSPHYNHYGLND